VRNRYKNGPIILPATVLYRWFNRISTCNALFNVPELGGESCFESYVDTNRIEILRECLRKTPTPHVTGAFIITGKPGFAKTEGVLRYFDDWCKKNWYQQWIDWHDRSITLLELYSWLMSDCQGLGSFMTAQLVADLKYSPDFKNAPDWWTWAAPGPGSMRGMNIVLGRDMETHWNAKEWLQEVQKLREIENDRLAPLGPFHAQDTQNHLCEYSKYCKVLFEIGRPRQVYRHA